MSICTSSSALYDREHHIPPTSMLLIMFTRDGGTIVPKMVKDMCLCYVCEMQVQLNSNAD